MSPASDANPSPASPKRSGVPLSVLVFQGTSEGQATELPNGKDCTGAAGWRYDDPTKPTKVVRLRDQGALREGLRATGYGAQSLAAGVGVR